MRDGIAPLLDDLETDTRNVLLTLARIWTTVETGRMLPKDEAADWALARLPAVHRPSLEVARAGYRGERRDEWGDLAAARFLADALVERIGSAS